MTEKTRCKYCGKPFPDNPGKWDPKAPVYADTYAYHLSCEDAVFEEVNCKHD